MRIQLHLSNYATLTALGLNPTTIGSPQGCAIQLRFTAPLQISPLTGDHPPQLRRAAYGPRFCFTVRKDRCARAGFGRGDAAGHASPAGCKRRKAKGRMKSTRTALAGGGGARGLGQRSANDVGTVEAGGHEEDYDGGA